MLSTQDRLIYLSFGIGVANVTTYSGQYLVNNVRDFLKSENYDKAIGLYTHSLTHSLTPSFTHSLTHVHLVTFRAYNSGIRQNITQQY